MRDRQRYSAAVWFRRNVVSGERGSVEGGEDVGEKLLRGAQPARNWMGFIRIRIAPDMARRGSMVAK